MERPYFLNKIREQLAVHPVCAIIGPRQVGKTTLAKQYAEKYFNEEAHFIDLEDPMDILRLQNPIQAFSAIKKKLIVIDEIQRRPDLFPVLRVIIDRERGLADQEKRGRSFLILGSASRHLIRQSSETLTGRIGYLELYPFSLFEVTHNDRLWVRGGFPESYLAQDDHHSLQWRKEYIRTFLEQDIPNLGYSIASRRLSAFWSMLSHYHGQTFNSSEIARSLDLSHKTVKNYLDILVGTFMVRRLMPWFENSKKRQVKSPKIFFRDSGLLHCLVGRNSMIELQRDPRIGSFWEGYALEEILRYFNVPNDESFFWGTQGGAELDLLLIKGEKRYGFEFKYSDSPSTTKSMHTALDDLRLEHIYVVHPGDKEFPLTEKITALPLPAFFSPSYSFLSY